MHQPQRPFDRSYWVIPGVFLAGFFPASGGEANATGRGHALIRCGVRQIINMMEEHEGEAAGFGDYGPLFQRLASDDGVELRCQRMPIPDFSVPTSEQMSAILDQIDQAIAEHRTLYLHCHGGKGRTGTVVGCWLVRHGHGVGQQAIDLLNDLRRGQDSLGHIPAPETEAQRQMVRDWRVGQ